MSIKRRLVLTFDAFGTLFYPKDTIGKQYAQVAGQHGISGFTSDQLDITFRHGKVAVPSSAYVENDEVDISNWLC